ncbi:hypothetical protein Lal_00008630 [Lupinus albus]|nr:hypothetical protein Lal_00008630 [Lupinus albus]
MRIDRLRALFLILWVVVHGLRWLLRGTIGSSRWKFEAITGPGNLVKLRRAGDRALQLLLFNEESLVSASHQLALITSLPFVHTARLLPIEWLSEASGLAQRGGQLPLRPESSPNRSSLEEVKVVTRSPLVNQRRDHYRVYNSQTPVNILNCCLGGSARSRILAGMPVRASFQPSSQLGVGTRESNRVPQIDWRSRRASIA